MKLTELLEQITALPWQKRSGDPATENEVCYVRGVTIFGPKRAVACNTDARYIEHAANVLPALIQQLKSIRDSKTILTAKDLRTIAANAISMAEEVKDHSGQLTPATKPQTVTMP